MSAPGARILVVDDDVPVCVVLAEMLQRAGYDVSMAWRVDDAFEMLAGKTRFDLAIVDVRMPDMSGMQFADSVRQIDSGLKVLFCTAYPAAMHDAGRALAGSEALIVKPVTSEQLVDAVARLLAA